MSDTLAVPELARAPSETSSVAALSPRSRAVAAAFRHALAPAVEGGLDADDVAVASSIYGEELKSRAVDATGAGAGDDADAGAGAGAGDGGPAAPLTVSFASRAAAIDLLRESVDASGCADVTEAIFATKASGDDGKGDDGKGAVDVPSAIVDALRSARVLALADEPLSEDEDGDDDGDDDVAGRVTAGAHCLALLTEDGDWHEAVVKGVHDEGADAGAVVDLTDVRYDVVFTEWGKPQVVSAAECVLLDDVADDSEEDESGLCEMCGRTMPLTRHHLIPRVMHPRYKNKDPKKYTDAFLNTCALICRPCHNAVHRFKPNRELARSFNTVALLMAQDEIQRWTKWVATQPVVTMSRARGVHRYRK